MCAQESARGILSVAFFGIMMLQCGGDESFEKRMCSIGTRFELGMILNAHIERTIGKLDRFNEPAVGRKA